ncbi:MAG: hypothetical protein WCX65_12300 [bacterium]
MKTRAILAAFVLMLAATAASAEPVLLRYKFSTGDVLIYALEATGAGKLMTSVFKSAGDQKPMETSEVPVNMKVKMSLETDVESVDKNNIATVLTRVTAYKLTQDGQDVINLKAGDEKKETAGNGIASPLKDLYKNPIRMELDQRGVIKKISGLEKLSETLPQMDVANLFEQTQHQLPEKAVDVGDEWTQEMNLEMNAEKPGKQTKFRTRYKFIGYEEVKDLRCAKIRVDGDGDISDILKTLMGEVETSNVKFNNMEIGYNGDLYFAADEGVLVAFDFTISQNVAAVMDVKLGNEMKHIDLNVDLTIDGFYELE